MKIALTLHNLLHQKVRTLVAIVGVAFSILLIFMQLGFYGSAEATATMFLSKLDFDLIVISTDYLDINRPGEFPRSRLYQAPAVTGVVSVSPLYISGTLWRIVSENPDQNRLRRGIMVVGFNLADRPFLLDLESEIDKLKSPGTVLIDTRTRDYFGQRHIGLETELGLTHIAVVGEFTIGTGYGSDGALMMSERTFSSLFGGMPLDRINVGLIKLTPGADPTAAATTLRAALPDDEVRVLTRTEMLEREKDFWLNKTSVGKIFFIGVVVALIVGVVFVYQVLSSDVANRYPEYATLKAMGYEGGYLARLVLEQAVVYALLGYIPGLLCSLWLYELGAALANLPIGMTWGRAGAVLLLSLAMCVFSALLAVRKVRSADPADLF